MEWNYLVTNTNPNPIKFLMSSFTKVFETTYRLHHSIIAKTCINSQSYKNNWHLFYLNEEYWLSENSKRINFQVKIVSRQLKFTRDNHHTITLHKPPVQHRRISNNINKSEEAKKNGRLKVKKSKISKLQFLCYITLSRINKLLLSNHTSFNVTVPPHFTLR